MSEEGEYDTGEDVLEEEQDCDYGAEFCVEPALKETNCCFECWLYLEMVEEQEKEQRKKEAKPSP